MGEGVTGRPRAHNPVTPSGQLPGGHSTPAGTARSRGAWTGRGGSALSWFRSQCLDLLGFSDRGHRTACTPERATS